MKTTLEMLQEAQDLLKLNQKELGVYIGVSTRTVNSWMTGDRQCPAYVAEMALRLAKVDAEALDEDEPTTGLFRWAVIMEDDHNEWLTVCGSKADALREGEDDWKHMTSQAQDSLIRYEVALIHVQVNDEYVGSRFSYYQKSGRVDGDTYEIAKKYI